MEREQAESYQDAFGEIAPSTQQEESETPQDKGLDQKHLYISIQTELLNTETMILVLQFGVQFPLHK